MAAINLKKSDAYVLGEIRGNLMAQGKDKDPRVLLEWGKIQTAVDAEIKNISDASTTTYTTGRVGMILEAGVVDQDAARAVVGELNGLLGEDVLKVSVFISTEHRRIIQSYLQGFYDGMFIALPGDKEEGEL